MSGEWEKERECSEVRDENCVVGRVEYHYSLVRLFGRVWIGFHVTHLKKDFGLAWVKQTINFFYPRDVISATIISWWPKQSSWITTRKLIHHCLVVVVINTDRFWPWPVIDNIDPFHLLPWTLFVMCPIADLIYFLSPNWLNLMTLSAPSLKIMLP